MQCIYIYIHTSCIVCYAQGRLGQFVDCWRKTQIWALCDTPQITCTILENCTLQSGLAINGLVINLWSMDWWSICDQWIGDQSVISGLVINLWSMDLWSMDWWSICDQWIGDQSVISGLVINLCAKRGLKLLLSKQTRNRRVELRCPLKIVPTLIINHVLRSGSVAGMAPDKKDFISSSRSLLGHCVPNLDGKEGFHSAWAASRWAIV